MSPDTELRHGAVDGEVRPGTSGTEEMEPSRTKGHLLKGSSSCWTQGTKKDTPLSCWIEPVAPGAQKDTIGQHWDSVGPLVSMCSSRCSPR